MQYNISYIWIYHYSIWTSAAATHSDIMMMIYVLRTYVYWKL